MSTRAQIVNIMARRLGAWTGDISSGTALTAVLGTRTDTTGDDNIARGDILWMLDAANETDKDRVIDEWDDSEATARWIKARSDTTYTAETYIVMPGRGEWARADFYAALNDRLAKTRRTVTSVIPTANNQRLYRLGNLSWIRHRGDIDAVYYRSSRNVVDNAQFDNWGSGPAAAPTRWTLAGSAATVARATAGVRRGHFGSTLTRAGADATLTQSIGLLDGQLAGQAVTFEADMVATVASRARIGISDGLTTTYSSYHTGGGGVERLAVDKTLSASATAFDVILSVDTGDTSATFSNVAGAEGSTVDTVLQETGDEAQSRRDLRFEVRETGGVPAIELASPLGRGGQLLVRSAQPFPALTADTQSTDCPDSVIVPGALYELGSRYPKGKLYDRYEKIALQCAQEYSIEAARLRQMPDPRPQGRVLVRSA